MAEVIKNYPSAILNIVSGTYTQNIIDLVQEFEVTMDGEEITFNVIDDVPKTSSKVFYIVIVLILLTISYVLINKSKKLSKVSSY